MEPAELGRDALYGCSCGNAISADTLGLLPGKVELGQCTMCGAVFFVMRDHSGELFIAEKD